MSNDPHNLDIFSGESIIKGLSKKKEAEKLLEIQKILGLESSNLAEMISLINLDEIFLNLVSEKYLSDKNPFSFNSSSKLPIIDISFLINSDSISDK